jgi:hypothetical protein
MKPRIATYLEVGGRRVFAGALEWPGWSRSGREEDAALQALVDYGPRYVAAVAAAAGELTLPTDASALEVVERLKGNATTDFGTPAVPPARDDRPLDEAELQRQAMLLRACWAAFDAAAEAASAAVLRKGPRGGGRMLDAIVGHVLESDRAYLVRLGGRHQKTPDAEAMTEMVGLRAMILDVLSSRAHGEPPSRSPRARSSTAWTPRYFVRRSAWHALDHAWEIQDRAIAAP